MRDELWIKHDARSRLDPKMARFIKHFGMLGYGTFWALIELLHYQNDHEIDLSSDDLEGIADTLKIAESDLKLMIEAAIEGGLFRREGTRFFQARLKQEQAERSRTKQNAGRLGGLKSAETRRERAQELETLKEQNSESIQQESKQSKKLLEATKLDKREEREEREEIRIEHRGDTPLQPPPTGFCFPEKWGDRAKASFEKWVAYRKALRKPLKPHSYQAQINHYADNPRLFAALVDRAELNGWQGLNEQIPLDDKNGGSKNAPRKAQCLINQEATIEAGKQILQELGYEIRGDDIDVDKV